MNKFLLVLVIFFSSINAFSFIGQSVIGSITSNPGTSAVLASTGALPSTGSHAATPSANYMLGFVWACSVAETYEFQILNASSVVQSSVLLPCVPNTLNLWDSAQVSFPIADGYTVRVINLTSFTGTGQATILYAIETVN